MGQVEGLTERSDVFALGAILCEVLTRQPPYTGTVQDQIMAAAQARLEEAYGRLDACNAPDALKQLARDCLEPLPKDRPKDAGVVAQRVGDHLTSVEERARQAEIDAVHAAAVSRRVQRGRRTTVALAAVALVAILGGAGGVYAWREAERARASEAAAKVAPCSSRRRAARARRDWPAAKAAAATALTLAETEGADGETLATVRALRARIDGEAEVARAREEKRRARDHADPRPRRRADAEDGPHPRRSGERVPQDVRGVRRGPRGGGRGGSVRRLRPTASSSPPTWTGGLGCASGREATGGRSSTASPARSTTTPGATGCATPRGRATCRPCAVSRPTVDPAAQDPATLWWLGDSLSKAGDSEAAVALLRRSLRDHPADPFLHHKLCHDPLVGAAAGARRDAPRPGRRRAPAPERRRLEHARSRPQRRAQGPRRRDPGLPSGDRAPTRDRDLPHQPRLRVPSRRATSTPPSPPAARRSGIEPKLVWAYDNLGLSLFDKGDLDGAIAVLREGIRIDPTFARATTASACVSTMRRLAHREAVLDPGHAAALGTAPSGPAYREAVRLDPKGATAHHNLGLVLQEKGDFEGAVAEYREAVKFEPSSYWGWVNMGVLLCDRLGRYDEAIAAFREAIRIDPKIGQAYVNVGVALNKKGDLEAAIEPLRTGLTLDPRLTRRQGPAGGGSSVSRAVSPRLPAVLSGKERPSSAEEWALFAELCFRTKDYASSARLYKEALRRGSPVRGRLEHRASATRPRAPRLSRAPSGTRRRSCGCGRSSTPGGGGSSPPRRTSPRRCAPGRPVPTSRPSATRAGLSDEWRALWARVDALLARAEGAPK